MTRNHGNLQHNLIKYNRLRYYFGAGKRNRTPDLLITNQYKHKGLVAEPYSDIVILFIVVENAFRVGCSWGHIKYVATLSYFQTNMLE